MVGWWLADRDLEPGWRPHVEFLLQADVHVWLLTEVPESLVAPVYVLHPTRARMARSPMGGRGPA